MNKIMNKQEDCNTCDGQGYWFYTEAEIDKWCQEGGDYWLSLIHISEPTRPY